MEYVMKSIRSFPTALLFLLATLTFTTFSAHAWTRLPATTFGLLPKRAANPEALTVDKYGQVYVSTFSGGGLYVFSPTGKLIRSMQVTPSSGSLLNLAFHPDTGALLVLDFGYGELLDVDPYTGSASVVADIPNNPGINDLTFDSAGNVYISDSFQGTIWRTGPQGGAVEEWLTNPLLRTTGFPGFGANGLAFNKDESALFVANTGDDTIIRVPVDSHGAAGEPEVFANGINGPDGLMIDKNDNIWIAANQNNEIQVLDPTGKAIAVLGDFEGITKQGIVAGLLFPSDLAHYGRYLYVANFALDVRNLGVVQTQTSQWAAMVKRYSIAKIPFEIPPLSTDRQHCGWEDYHGNSKTGWKLSNKQSCN
jgi:sugar lactone lactonase YvrE